MKPNPSAFPSEEVKARWADLILTGDRVIEQNQTRFARRLRCHRVNEIKSYGLEWSRSALLLMLAILFGAGALFGGLGYLFSPIPFQNEVLAAKELRPVPQDIFEFDKTLKGDVEKYESEKVAFQSANLMGGYDPALAAKEEKLRARVVAARAAYEKAVAEAQKENEEAAAHNQIVEEKKQKQTEAKEQRKMTLQGTLASAALAAVFGLMFYLSQSLHVEIEFRHGKIRRSLKGSDVNMPQIMQFFESMQKVLNDYRDVSVRLPQQEQSGSEAAAA